MRKLILGAAVAIATFGLHAQTLQGLGQKKVADAITKLFEGIAALDIAEISACVTSDITILEDGAVWNMDSIQNIITRMKTMPFKRTNELNFIQTIVRGNTAWVVYHNTAHMTMNGQVHDVNWMESAVLVKEGDDWKVSLLHSTTLAQKKGL